ncbi:MAG: RNA polymerase sigma factor [Acidimicrobiales bacterium]
MNDDRARVGRVVSFRRRYSSLSVEELVELAAARDVDAFEELMNRHRRMVCGVCVRMTRTEQDAEDVVSTVQWAVWQKLPGFERRSKFSTWLYQVTVNATIGFLRKRNPEPVGDSYEPPDPGAGFARAPQDDVVDLETLRWALARLPHEARAALLLKECEGLSLEEIAEIQIVALGTVKSRISRARAMLVQLVEECAR